MKHVKIVLILDSLLMSFCNAYPFRREVSVCDTEHVINSPLRPHTHTKKIHNAHTSEVLKTIFYF